MENSEIINEIKPKSVIIDGELHNRFKLRCKRKCMKIGGVIEDLIQLYLDNTTEIQKMIDNNNNEKHTNNR